jgi:hypothetical protein
MNNRSMLSGPKARLSSLGQCSRRSKTVGGRLNLSAESAIAWVKGCREFPF